MNHRKAQNETTQLLVERARIDLFGIVCVGSRWVLYGHVLYDGKIFTGEPDHPYAEAVAIRGDKIVALGTNAEAAAAVGKSADNTDLEGRCLLPGLIDTTSIQLMAASLSSPMKSRTRGSL